ncbi:MAG: PAS domain S-box protein [Leptospira sp.]|nr:PAS domain S-box protein [Leptospira sp.]
MKKKDSKSIKMILSRALVLISLFISLLVAISFAFFERKNILNSADEKLLASATFYQEISGKDYHNRLKDEKSISQIEYENFLDRNGNLCRQLGLQYLWSVVEKNDNILFTSATRSDFDDPNSSYAGFFEIHKDPNAFRLSLENLNQPVYISFQNEWGEGRMVLISSLDDLARIYIIGASIHLEDLDRLVYRAIIIASLFGVVIFGSTWIISRRFTRKLVVVCHEVANTANEIRLGNYNSELPRFDILEAENLTNSLGEMKIQMKNRVQDFQEITIFQSTLLEISSKYINIPYKEIDLAINDSLKFLGEIVDADRVYVFDYHWEENFCTNTYEWCNERIEPEIMNNQYTPLDPISDWVVKHKKNEIISIYNLDELPEDEFKSKLKAQGIKSILLQPMMQGNNCIGFVGFDWVRDYHRISENEKILLSFYAKILVNLLNRYESEADLNRFKYIADNALYGKAITDLNGNIVYINKFFAQIHGYEQYELLGKNLSIFHNEKQMRIVGMQLRNLMEEGQFESLEIWHTHKSGKEFPMLMTGLLIHDDYGKPEYLAATAIDITELNLAKNRIEHLLKSEQHLDNNIRNFTQIVSHNLRIHTANMIGIIMMLKDTDPELFQNQSIRMIQSASENLEETIRDLNAVLEIKFDNDLSKSSFSLKNLVIRSIKNLIFSPEQNEVEIKIDIEDDLKIVTIEKYLSSILENIIWNGIKYRSSERDSWVKVSSEISENKIKICIEDNGTGIDLYKNGKDLFKMYKKFHNSPDSKGFGLYLTQVQVEALGGSIEVDSVIGIGSKFTVVLPYE